LPNIDNVVPWECDEWDPYVAGHPAATLYHTSRWCQIVAETGRYLPRFLLARDGKRVTGVLPALEVRSRLTGNRLVSLPFSDVSYPIADEAPSAEALIDTAVAHREQRRLKFFEMRGLPAVRRPDASAGGGNDFDLQRRGFQPQGHFFGYKVPLSPDADAVRMTFSRKSIRQTISKSHKLGVTVRRGESDGDLREFYRLYTLNRKRHGIPPQPFALFSRMLAHLTHEPEARLYIADFEGTCAAALIVIRYRGVSYAKYEGVDEAFRHVFPVNAVFWQTIHDACDAGDHTYDFGRTAADNRGLNEFKSRWGTNRVELPYYFHPPGEGLSVVKSDSMKYRLFTGFFRRLPVELSVRLGERIFRHFG
jgi:CelD/BcsL family acetyltransferase involved in cellulose biosynthesis